MGRPVLTAALEGFPGEIQVDAELVEVLLAQQHPNLATLPLRPSESGFDNYMFRLGESFAVRMPRSAAAARLIVHEQRWLITLSDRLPVQIPVPIRVGLPGFGYPWRWSVVPWLSGATAEVAPVAAREAPRLATFLRALHVAAPGDAPYTPIDPPWSRTGSATRGARRSRCRTASHRPGSMVTCTRDEAARDAAMRVYGTSDTSLWVRAGGWVLFGVMLLDTGLAANARNAVMGEQILRRI